VQIRQVDEDSEHMLKPCGTKKQRIVTRVT